MKNKFKLLLFLLIGFQSCEKENLGDCFKSTGKIRTETRALSPITAIKLDDRINLHVNFENQFELSVKAGKNLLDLIKTEVQGNTLTIKNDNKCNWVRSFKPEIDVFLTVPFLKDFTFYGGGEVHFTNKLISDTFRLELWSASGNLNLWIDADYLTLKSNTGPGDVFCKGKARELVGFNNGLGTVDAGQVDAEYVLAINNNSGKLIVNAEKELNAEIRADGNIEYFGFPNTINLKKTGSGLLIQKN